MKTDSKVGTKKHEDTKGKRSRYSVETWAALSLVGLCYAGYLKGSPLLNWLPVDATALFAGFCVASWVAYALRSSRVFLGSMRRSVLLLITFVPGAWLAVGHGFYETKLIYLFVLVPLCLFLPSIIATSPYAQGAWLSGQIAVGLAVGIGILAFPKASHPLHVARVDMEGGTTIATSRALGSAAIVLITLGIAMSKGNRARRFACWGGAVLAAVFMLSVGSRGPVVALIVAILLVLVTARIPSRARVIGAIGTLIVAGLLAAYVDVRSTSAFSRVLILLSGGVIDPARDQLYAIAARQIVLSPEGLGWGGFGYLPSVFGAYGRIYPHNMFLEVLVEGGWIAGVAFALYAVVALMRLRQLSQFSCNGLVFYGLALYWLIAAQFSGDVVGNRATWAALAFGFGNFAIFVKDLAPVVKT